MMCERFCGNALSVPSLQVVTLVPLNWVEIQTRSSSDLGVAEIQCSSKEKEGAVVCVLGAGGLGQVVGGISV